jgi:transposase-like protein
MSTRSDELTRKRCPGEDTLTALFRQFEIDCPSEEKAIEIVACRIEQRQPKCSNCQSTDIDLKEGKRSYRCRRCKKSTWRTAGTLFHGVRYTRPLLALTWLMEKGVVVSAWKLAQLTDIAYSSAWATIKKLMLAIEKDMGDELPEVRSLLFRQAIYKRSRETPARQHPQCEEVEQPEELAERQKTLDRETRQRDSLIAELDAVQKQVYEHLTDQPVHFDVICERLDIPVGNLSGTLMCLELSGLVTSISSNFFLRKQLPGAAPNLQSQNGKANRLAHEVRQAIAGFVQAANEHFRGISRKYLQLFLAGHWCTQDRERWPAGAVFDLCATTRPIKYAAIGAYVSPFLVKIGIPHATAN